ncbi:unnamed protein product [Spirodela intermedia]|uniref:FAD dependent oxidoreductase domain-containing protein n=1 Tax=Spirodela intermedia TaxID=51605 RepID=A0A7I8LDH4_SPIIN|nr:unnamed protein product [Spirodela intermedia]
MAAAFDSRFCLCGGALRRSKDIQNAIPDWRGSFTGCVRRRRSSSAKATSSSSASLPQPVRYAVLGAGFAGLSVAWHLLESNPKESPLVVDLYDEGGIGGGASGVAGGLIHPCSPKGKLLWRSAEFWRECLKLLSAAEQTLKRGTTSDGERMIWRRGIIRPATTMKNAEILKENASNSLSCFRREFLDRDAAQKLVPGLCVSFDSSIYMPHAVNIHAGRYLQALFSACKSMADDASSAGSGRMEVNLFKRSIESLHELQGNYNCVIICLGAKAAMLPELSGLLPLRLCRGIVTHMKLPDATSDVYEDGSPSILSDAWLAVQGPRSLVMGSTWDWGSRDYSSSVSPEEASRALDELLPKAASVYPAIERWAPVGASGGLRAMPPLTPLGSLPLLGCLDDIVGDKGQRRYWLVGGLGARGLLYHGLLGKLTSQAVMSQDEDILPSELTSWKRLLLKARG